MVASWSIDERDAGEAPSLGFDHRAEVIVAQGSLLLKMGSDGSEVVFGQGFMQRPAIGLGACFHVTGSAPLARLFLNRLSDSLRVTHEEHPVTTRYTTSGVRMRLHSSGAGNLNWLVLPGGPGLGSESLQELAEALDVPGSIWLVDLPGDGSNTARADRDPFARWPQVLVEAAKAFSHVIFVGHSTGGMYLLATPQLRGHIRGLALLDTAADCSWHAQFVEMTRNHPLPAFDHAAAAYEQDPSAVNLRRVAVASADWNFTPKALDAGRALLARLPYNGDAVAWSEASFDHTYKAAWWPIDIPVLRLWGDCDRIVSQQSWDADEYATTNVMTRVISDAGHFPWIENPVAVRSAFNEFVERILHG